MERARAEALLGELDEGWCLNAAGHLERTYAFKDFAVAMAFGNQVAAIAEAEGHHPDLHIAWGKCGVEVWTHKIKGLTESDFYFAAKVDRAFTASAKL
jgi:4a-hydroxytetrahydrobiopterin dehydratase